MNGSKILEYRPDCHQTIRRLYGLDKPERMNEALEILETWIKQQKHFVKKDFDKTYLENSLIASKGSIEMTKTRLDKMCTYRTFMPIYFGSFNPKKDFRDLKNVMSVILPKVTKDNYRIILIKNFEKNINSSLMLIFYRYCVCLLEYLRANDCNDGYIAIFDYTETNLKDLLPAINPSDLNQVLQIVIEGFGTRVRGIHFVTSSKVINALVSIVKQFLSSKLGKRIHVHKDYNDLHKHVPIELMPKEYGGKEKPLFEMHDDLLDAMSCKEQLDFLTEMSKAKIDESFRSTEKFNEQYIGMPGTFRTLSVD